MSGRVILPVTLLFGLVASCAENVGNLPPVGGEQASLAEQKRYVRHLYLDLTGKPPSEAELAAAMVRLEMEGNSAATRRGLAQQAMDLPAFGETFVAELENRVFAGETPSSRFGLICGVTRSNDPACASCGPPPGGDACDGCACAALPQLSAEQDSFAAAPADLNDGASTSSIERRYGGALVIRSSFGDGGQLTIAEFQTFLGRDAEGDEVRNGAAIVQGSLLSATAPAGLLFHRHGSNFDDFIEILFSSEAYREAVVDRVFLRYLGRGATPSELAVFGGALDPDDPDARAAILAVVSSREYFEQ